MSFVVVATGTVGENRFVDSARSTEGSKVELILVPGSSQLANAVNSAIESSTGQLVAIVSASDRLMPGAITSIETELLSSPGIGVLYGDDIEHGTVVLRPEFSPERLRCQNYLGGLVGYSREILAEVGALREDLPGAELYDLVLRATRSAELVSHLATPLIEIAGARPLASVETSVALNSIREVLTQHLAATGGGYVNAVSLLVNDTRRYVVGTPLVSIVIPTRGDSATVRGELRCMVVEAVRSIITVSTYVDIEIIVVVDDVTPPAVRRELDEIAGARVRFVEWSGPFSFSGKMNLGVVHARGEFVLFLNDDIEVISPDWISAMLALAQRPGAGIVGSMLYFEDETIQHAGHAYYRTDVTHIGFHSPRGAKGPSGAFEVEREVNGVTAACALMPRDVFFEVGGFSTLLPGNFNDVDLCLKIAVKGYQAYWTPHAELYHFESQSRDPKVAAYEIERAWGRWEHALWDSTFWPDNPHLTYPVESSAD